MTEKHGRRYSLAEKREILAYRKTHTYEETSQNYGVSQMTLARWSKRIMPFTPNTPEAPKPVLAGARPDLGSLLQVLKSIDGVTALALISVNGEIVASLGTGEIGDSTIIGATAAALSLGDRTAKMLQQGNLDIMLVKSSGGATLIAGAGEQAALVILLGESVELSKLFTQDFPLVEKIRNVIKSIY